MSYTPDRELTPPDRYYRNCSECGAPMSEDKDYWCSIECFLASLK